MAQMKYGLLILATSFTFILCRPGITIDDSPEARKLFHLADVNNNSILTYPEFHGALFTFDEDGDKEVRQAEFLKKWMADGFGPLNHGVNLFYNFDVNGDQKLTPVPDFHAVEKYFDRDDDGLITTAEFVIQWVKISIA